MFVNRYLPYRVFGLRECIGPALTATFFSPFLCGNSVYSTFFRSTESRLWDCRVVSVEVVTHNCKLFCCELPDGVIMRVPIGHHIHLHRDVEGKENYWSLVSMILLVVIVGLDIRFILDRRQTEHNICFISPAHGQ